jgi:GT2 family glycosyltransferase
VTLVVIIPTFGRKELLPHVLARLAMQTRPPDAVILSAPDASHVGPLRHDGLRIDGVFGRTGLTAQRNHALEAALPHFDLVTFLDDDFLPGRRYLEAVETLLDRHRDWMVLSGHVALDGANGAGYSPDHGLTALHAAEAAATGRPPRVTDTTGAYGCNMSMRSADIGAHRFDERLALYGWQEDIDFSRRIAAGRRIVRSDELVGVHLGYKTGRISGLRLGYSQMVNPVYLTRKGTMPAPFAARLMARNLAANLLRCLRPEPYVDRRGRLRGNLRGLGHLLRGRVEPEHILQL